MGFAPRMGEVFRCMGYVMPSLRARPARVGSFENSAFRFGSLSDCPAHVGICSAAGACALWALGSSRLCEEVGTEPHGSAAALGSPRPCGEVSYSGTSSEFSRGSTSLVRESSGKMSPTPSASGVLPPMWGSWAGRSEASFRSGMLSAHVGRFLNGFPSTPDALAVPFVWGCFAVGAVEPPPRGLSRPRRGRMGETGIVSPPGGIRRVRHRRCRGVRETPFSEGQPAGFIAAGGEEV